MLQLNQIRNNRNEVIDRLKIKNFDAESMIDTLLNLDEDRRKNLLMLENIQAEANSIAKEIGLLFKEGKQAEANDLKNKSTALKDSTKELSQRAEELDKELQDMLVRIPNLPGPTVPKGKTPEDNEVIHEHGKIPEFSFEAKPHWDLANDYDLIDFELGVKITGAGFPVYKGQGAKLQRALINFFLDRASSAGYNETQPPILINAESGFGTGQLPDKEGQMYHVGIDDLYLIPTAEVPLTNIYRDTIVAAKDLPVKICGYTPCFRREAGSYGKDVRGLNRLHQFDKVEIVQIQHPDNSYAALEDMKDHVASLVEALGLPYRILRLCGGDMSFASALTYDFEVYSAAQKKWLEVSSVSNFETFQANRLKLRYREGDAKPVIAHTLNGSALALPRIVAALLENNQEQDGIRIPAVLHPYIGFEKITK